MARFSVGDQVVIVGGPAAGHVGIVSAIDEESATVVVRASVFNREVPVKASFDEVRERGTG